MSSYSALYLFQITASFLVSLQVNGWSAKSKFTWKTADKTVCVVESAEPVAAVRRRWALRTPTSRCTVWRHFVSLRWAAWTVAVVSVCADTTVHAVTLSIEAVLLCVTAVDKSLSSSLADARDALINAVVDMLTAYRAVQGGSQSSSQLLCPYQLRHVALHVLAMLKSVSPSRILSR